MSGGFFGFDAVLPERRGGQHQQHAPSQQPPQPQRYNAGAGGGNPLDDDAFGAGAVEDIAVYTWGTEEYDDGLGNALLEGGDDLNDLTFGDEPVGTDFHFSHHAKEESFSGRRAHAKSSSKSAAQPKKRNEDLFASTEADFFAVPKKATTRTRTNKETTTVLSSSKPTHTVTSAAPAWGAAAPTQPPSQTVGITPSQSKVRTLEEIEAEMLAQSSKPQAPTAPVPPTGPRALTMEELERQMLQNMVIGRTPTETQPLVSPAPPSQPSPLQPPQAATTGQPPVRQPPMSVQGGFPPQHLPQQATFPMQSPGNAMFPPLGAQPPAMAQHGQQQQGHAIPSEQVSMDLERKIMETEMAEAKRRRKAAKIASMAKYNDIMTGGDKEFITRIQLSQLVTEDPYASDFYAQVYSAIARSKLAAQGAADPNAPSVLQVGADGRGLGVGIVRGAPGRTAGRLRDNAMQRMTMQVKRIVDNAKNRGMKPASASLQGALGKTGHRSTAAGPRPALQVSSASRNTTHALTAMLTSGGGQTDGQNANGQSRVSPLTPKQVALRLEGLYEAVLDLEQARRNQPPPPNAPEQQAMLQHMGPEEAQRRVSQFEDWVHKYEADVEKMWEMLMVQQPLEISDPHPFISLLTPVKGHRLFARLMRHLSPSQSLTVVILLLACFPQLDVVKNAPSPASLFSGLALDVVATRDKQARLRATESFLAGVVPVLVGVIGRLDLKLVAGLINMCGDRWDAATVMSTRPGVALFTILLSRAEMLKHIPSPPAEDPTVSAIPAGPAHGDLEQWNSAFLGLLRSVLAKLPSIFPSTQAQASAFGPAAYLLGSAGGGLNAGEIGSQNDREGMMMDAMDGEVWGLIAAMALHAPPEEQTALVSVLREKILHTVQSAKKGWVSPPRAEVRLRNVNLFLNGLGLDATMLEI